MIALLAIAMMTGGTATATSPGFDPCLQEETGVPIEPFSGLDGGYVKALFPDEWGLDGRRALGWFGSVVVGGNTWGGGVEFMTRFTWRQWDRLDFVEANGEALAEPIESRIRQLAADVSADVGIGPLRFGVTVGGGLYLLKHELEREVAPAGEGGLYLRIKPVEWFYVEGGALAGVLRDDFNREETRTDMLWTAHVSAGIELRF